MNCYKKILQITYSTVFLIIVCLLFIPDTSAIAQQQNKYLNYANQLLKQKQPKMAENVLSAGIVKHPSDIRLIYLRGKIRADNLNNPSGAFKDYSITIKHARKLFPKAYWRRGSILAGQGMTAYAIKDYTRCLQLLPKYGKVYFMRAKAYTQLGMRRKAKRDLLKCLRYSPVYKDAVKRYMLEHQL